MNGDSLKTSLAIPMLVTVEENVEDQKDCKNKKWSKNCAGEFPKNDLVHVTNQSSSRFKRTVQKLTDPAAAKSPIQPCRKEQHVMHASSFFFSLFFFFFFLFSSSSVFQHHFPKQRVKAPEMDNKERFVKASTDQTTGNIFVPRRCRITWHTDPSKMLEKHNKMSTPRPSSLIY